jgi:hypothetical protein
MPLRVVIALSVACFACPAAAAAQVTHVRVVAAQATIRESTDPSSVAVLVVSAGTVLEVSGQQTGWYEIYLPATSSSSRRRVYVSADAVEPFSRARGGGGPVLPPPDVTRANDSSNATAGLSADWQARYDRAVRRKEGGRRKAFIGIPLILTGGALEFYALFRGLKGPDEERKQLRTWLGAYGTLVPGVALALIGQRQIQRASEELLLLESERARVIPDSVLSHSILEWERRGATITMGIGTAKTAAIRVSW